MKLLNVNKSYFQYQKQERVEDFGLNIDFFKFRPSDPVLGRFWQIDPLAEQYVYNSPYALQENKFGRGVELEGKELLPWHQENKTIVVKLDNSNDKPKTETNTTTSIGAQIGAEAKILGFPLGVSIDLGSVNASDFSITESDNKTKVTNNTSDGYTTTKGYSIGVLVAGYEKKTSTTKNQDGSSNIKKESSINILGVTTKTTNTETKSSNGKVSNTTAKTIEIGQSAAKGKIIVSMGISATFSMPASNETKVQNYSSTDNTRVEKPKPLILKK
jgi:hypothetical protein